MKIRYFLVVLMITVMGFAYIVNVENKKHKQIKNENEEIITQLLSDRHKEKINKNNGNIETNQIKSLGSKAACVYDCKSKRILYGKNINDRLPMASTTKIMTCIVAIENGNMDEEVTISSYAASMPDVQLNAIKGDKYKLKDLLYSLMLESHNDVAVAIAEHIGAKKLNTKINIDDRKQSKEYVKEFAKLMNKKSKELGLSNTNFVTPNGLDADKHYTTAKELAIIAAYAIKNEDFIKITNKRSHIFSSDNKKRYVVNNRNQFLNTYQGAIGCKTGYTSKAGYCFVGAIDRKDYNMVSVVLGCGWPPNKNLKWQDTKKLMDYAVNNYNKTEIVVDENIFGNKYITVNTGKTKEKMSLSVKKKYNLLLSNTDNVYVKIKLVDNLVAPIKKGKIIGYVKVYINDEVFDNIDIKTCKTITDIKIIDKFTELLKLLVYPNVDNIF